MEARPIERHAACLSRGADRPAGPIYPALARTILRQKVFLEHSWSCGPVSANFKETPMCRAACSGYIPLSRKRRHTFYIFLSFAKYSFFILSELKAIFSIFRHFRHPSCSKHIIIDKLLRDKGSCHEKRMISAVGPSCNRVYFLIILSYSTFIQ